MQKSTKPAPRGEAREMNYEGVHVWLGYSDEEWAAFVERWGERSDAPPGKNTLEAQVEYAEDENYCLVLRCF